MKTKIMGSFLTDVRRALSKSAVKIPLLVGISISIGAAAAAQDHSAGDWHHGGAQGMTNGANDVVAHVNGMLQYVYGEVGATQAQKAQLAAISQKAADDLGPLHDQLDRAHSQVFSLLTQDNIDRAALETIRAEQMRVADSASRRVTQFVADVAEALTPAQRKALANHFAQHAG